MSVVQSEFDEEDFRPGLVLGETRADVPVDTRVRTDVACFLRVRWSPAPLDPESEGVDQLHVEDLPGSPGGDYLPFTLRHQELAEWDEDAFAGEFRTQQPALARNYFGNGGRILHLLDLTFSVPPFDPTELPEDEDPELIAEQRLEASFLRMYSWALERLDDFGDGSVSQIALPELWTRQVHLLPTIWGMVAGFCRQTGNRFCVADSCPPFKILQETERKRAREEGYELRPDELTPAALVPWYREDRWGGREDIPVEVALTLDALFEARRVLRNSEVTLSCLGVYWPWVRTQRGLAIPPCGAVAGIFARSDEENAPVGCMKPPANESVKGVTDVAIHLDERPRNMLQAAGVNLLAARAGKGILVWGARTLAEEDLWRFVNVRRLVGYIGKQLEMDNQWAIFENNDESLRSRLARDVQYFLHDLYELGALRGESPTEAFRVVCDAQNNPPEMVEAGILVVDVWVNPVQTNEFVHLQLKYGDASVQ